MCCGVVTKGHYDQVIQDGQESLLPLGSVKAATKVL
jgi:hypothetical protein